MGITEEKKRMRAALKQDYEKMTDEERAERSHRITEQILSSDEYRKADVIFCYVSVGKEPDTHILIGKMLSEGKTVLVPRCGRDGWMEAVQIHGMEELRSGMYGIPEPPGDREAVPPERIDLALIPAYAISPEGIRLGKGGGYYDRYLAEQTCRKWGITFFVLPVPYEFRDIRVERVFN